MLIDVYPGWSGLVDHLNKYLETLKPIIRDVPDFNC